MSSRFSRRARTGPCLTSQCEELLASSPPRAPDDASSSSSPSASRACCDSAEASCLTCTLATANGTVSPRAAAVAVAVVSAAARATIAAAPHLFSLRGGLPDQSPHRGLFLPRSTSHTFGVVTAVATSAAVDDEDDGEVYAVGHQHDADGAGSAVGDDDEQPSAGGDDCATPDFLGDDSRAAAAAAAAELEDDTASVLSAEDDMLVQDLILAAQEPHNRDEDDTAEDIESTTFIVKPTRSSFHGRRGDGARKSGASSSSPPPELPTIHTTAHAKHVTTTTATGARFHHDPYAADVLPQWFHEQKAHERRFGVGSFLRHVAAAAASTPSTTAVAVSPSLVSPPVSSSASAHPLSTSSSISHSLTATTAPAVMCCYHKQGKVCKMGAACWYSHEGDESTPCHYGAICKAGHACLARSNPCAPTNGQAPHQMLKREKNAPRSSYSGHHQRLESSELSAALPAGHIGYQTLRTTVAPAAAAHLPQQVPDHANQRFHQAAGEDGVQYDAMHVVDHGDGAYYFDETPMSYMDDASYLEAGRFRHRHAARHHPQSLAGAVVPLSFEEEEMQTAAARYRAERYEHQHHHHGHSGAVPSAVPSGGSVTFPSYPSPLPCQQCGATEGVTAQEFPMYQGKRRTTGVRGHCATCMATFLIAQ